VLLEGASSSNGLIGSAMLVNSLAGFVVPLLVGHWSDRHRESHRGRTPFIVGGALLGALGLGAIAMGTAAPFAVLTLLGGLAYFGVDTCRTAHRALVHDNFDREGHTRGTGAQEAGQLVGALLGLAVGGLLTSIAHWAPFVLAAVVTPALVWITIRRIPVDRVRRTSHTGLPLSFYARAMFKPGVRAILAAEMLWVLGYAALPVFFVIYAKNELGLGVGVASLWLAAFAAGSGVVMVLAGRVRCAIRHKHFLIAGVALTGGGFLGIALSQGLVAVSLTLVLAAIGFGLISTLGFALFASLIPAGDSGGFTALYFAVRSIASAVALPLVGWTIEATGSYRSLFWLAGGATLAALVPLSFAPRADGRRPFGAPLLVHD
jgi:MFS family permease